MQYISARGALARGAVAPPAGKLLLALRRLRRSRRGCAELRADAPPRSAAAPAASSNCPSLAGAGLELPAAAPALSACAPRLAQVRGVCLGPRGAPAWPRTPGLDAPAPLQRAGAGNGSPGRDLRSARTRANEAGALGGSLTLRSLAQHRL